MTLATVAERAWEITGARGQTDLSAPLTSGGALRRKPGKGGGRARNQCWCGVEIGVKANTCRAHKGNGGASHGRARL